MVLMSKAVKLATKPRRTEGLIGFDSRYSPMHRAGSALRLVALFADQNVGGNGCSAAADVLRHGDVGIAHLVRASQTL